MDYDYIINNFLIKFCQMHIWTVMFQNIKYALICKINGFSDFKIQTNPLTFITVYFISKY